MFDNGNAAFASPDGNDVEPYVPAHLPVVEKRERDDFAVSIIEQGTRLISRGSYVITTGWKHSQDIQAGHRNSTALGRHFSKEIIRRAWTQKLNKRTTKTTRHHAVVYDNGIINFVLSPEQLSQVLERAVHTLAPSLEHIKPRESQNFLPLVGDFSPSRKLVEFWARGVASHRPRNVSRAPEGKVQVSAQIQAEFAKMLQAVLATSGQQRRYGAERDTALTVDSRFVTLMQTELCEQFQIVPDEAGEFLALLYGELASALAEGAKIQGAWGCIRLTSNRDLVYQLADATFAKDDSFVMSEDVE